MSLSGLELRDLSISVSDCSAGIKDVDTTLVWWFEKEWPLEPHTFEGFVTRGWNTLKRSEGLGGVAL